MTPSLDIVDLSQATDTARFGAKASRLARLRAAGVATPAGFAIPMDRTVDLAEGGAATLGGALDAAVARLEASQKHRLGDPDAPLLLAVRVSADDGASGAMAQLNIGAGAAVEVGLARRCGLRAARAIRCRFIQSFAVAALGADAEALDGAAQAVDWTDAEALAALAERLLAITAFETGAVFPDDPRAQLDLALEAAARAWITPRARLMRQARGVAADAGLGLIVQRMALGLGQGVCGVASIDSRCGETGAPGLRGAWLDQAQGDEMALNLRESRALEGEGGLSTLAPETYAALRDSLLRAERVARDAVRAEITLDGGRVALLDAVAMPRGPRAGVAIAVDLVEEGRLSRPEALLRVDPGDLVAHLHPTVAPEAVRDPLGQGLAASPGAATGPVAFTADAAEVFAARGAPAILVRFETGPEDIRGMHVACAVVTARGGLTSHAAVVARGIGAPCVVGVTDMKLDLQAGVMRINGRELREGDAITVDGGAGELLAGAAPLRLPEFSGAFAKLMVWADAHRRMGVRANADTSAEARMARGFNVDGIGLCRTEHMFFEPERVTAMREMILAHDARARRAALDRLLPWQRADFVELFTIMQGLPVTIRLLDPPLHEFLPRRKRDLDDLAAAMGMDVSRVQARARELAEVNPMLGMRGCRLGVTYPEIYEMQARAIFEAAVEAGAATGAPVEPEIMIPLVSTNREMIILKQLVEKVALAVREETGVALSWKIGCMVETPRAALRAEEIAAGAEFLSFGTNDLTQMMFGLSRDDAGGFMRAYLAAGVFRDDPFQSLDVEAVGELLLMAAERGRRGRKDIDLGLCGEHGGDPASVRFCELAGFDYVSCSPFRAPIARLAAAQAHILALRGDDGGA